MDYDNYTLDELFRVAFHEENRLALAVLDRMEDETIRLTVKVESLEKVKGVIDDLSKRLKEAEALADEILTLNTKVPEIGHGKLLNLHQKASELKSMIGDYDAN